MSEFNLTQTLGADKSTRYSANGKRVSKARYDEIVERALRDGKLDCFHTKARQIGTTFRRTNYSSARWED